MSLDYQRKSAKVGGEPKNVLLLRAPMHKLVVAVALVAATPPCTAQLRLDVMPEATLLYRSIKRRRAALVIIANGF